MACFSILLQQIKGRQEIAKASVLDWFVLMLYDQDAMMK